jgi:hypothetical protein
MGGGEVKKDWGLALPTLSYSSYVSRSDKDSKNSKRESGLLGYFTGQSRRTESILVNTLLLDLKLLNI